MRTHDSDRDILEQPRRSGLRFAFMRRITLRTVQLAALLTSCLASAVSDAGALFDCTHGEPSASIRACTDLLRDQTRLTNDQRAYLLHTRSSSYQHLREYAKAIADLDAAMTLAPNNPYLYNSRAALFIDLGRLADASADLDKALQLDPTSALPHLNRAVIFRHKGNYAKVVTECSEAIERDRVLPEAYRIRADARFILKEFKQALADYDRFLELEPGDARGYSGRGAVYDALADRASAISNFRQALAINPHNSTARLMLEALAGAQDPGLPQAGRSPPRSKSEPKPAPEIPPGLRTCADTYLRLQEVGFGLPEAARDQLLNDPEYRAALASCEPRLTKDPDFLHGMDFVTPLIGWVVGWKGIVLHTHDGGATWLSQNPPDATHLLAVDFVDEKNGWAVGYDGLVIHTADGGGNWQEQARLGPSGISLLTISCADAQRCWIAGGTPSSTYIFATSDGGRNWSPQTFRARGIVKSIQFISKDVGWAISDGGDILGTRNGGKLWKQLASFCRETQNSVETCGFLRVCGRAFLT